MSASIGPITTAIENPVVASAATIGSISIVAGVVALLIFANIAKGNMPRSLLGLVVVGFILAIALKVSFLVSLGLILLVAIFSSFKHSLGR